MNAVLSFQSVVKQFGSKRVLDGLDLEIPPGAVVGLLGTNGSGKTTLLKCAVGLLRPQSGEIRLLGEPAWNLSAGVKRRLGYVPQVISLFPWLKVAELIRYTASFYANWNSDLSDRLMRQWDLPVHDRVGTLSVGQLQKLSILTAVSHEPDLVLLDEPAASLDPLARRQFLQLIIDLAEPGKRTVVFSTHITSDLERVADRVAILKQGRIAHYGTLDDLKEQTHLSLEDAFLEMHYV
ncbi:MAG TPA: ABC transporter ATP-binding protein [Tepidisphaeraceae bacterium]|nr:ABC transporter ATP-binding protein [Tepidisphaeraceae bacterium]